MFTNACTRKKRAEMWRMVADILLMAVSIPVYAIMLWVILEYATR
jgi:hypothetical protein